MQVEYLPLNSYELRGRAQYPTRQSQLVHLALSDTPDAARCRVLLDFALQSLTHQSSSLLSFLNLLLRVYFLIPAVIVT